MKLNTVIICFILALVSCSKSSVDPIDVPLNPKEKLVRLNGKAEQQLELRYSTSHRFVLGLNALSTQDVEINCVVDTALLHSYNLIFGTQYIPLAKNKYQVPDKIIIKAGKLQSDSVRITVNSVEELRQNPNLLLALKLTLQKGEEGLTMDDVNNRLYLSFTYHNIDPGQAVIGTELSKEFPSIWTAFSPTKYGTNTAAKIIDNQLSSPWITPAPPTNPPFAIIDMKAKHNISGFKIAPVHNIVGVQFNPKEIKISTSLDSITWINQGVAEVAVPSSGNVNAPPPLNEISLHTSVLARYVRFDLIKNNSTYSGISEVYVFQ